MYIFQDFKNNPKNIKAKIIKAHASGLFYHNQFESKSLSKRERTELLYEIFSIANIIFNTTNKFNPSSTPCKTRVNGVVLFKTYCYFWLSIPASYP